ncbi:unnamed protein product [Victoria cruziana]
MVQINHSLGENSSLDSDMFQDFLLNLFAISLFPDHEFTIVNSNFTVPDILQERLDTTTNACNQIEIDWFIDGAS